MCWVGTGARPDICARVARIASRINALIGGDFHRINEPVRIAKECQRATVLHRPLARGGRLVGAARQRATFIIGEGRHIAFRCLWFGGRMLLSGTSRREEGVDWVARSALTDIRHSAQWTSKFTRELVKSSLVGEVVALREMVDHTSPLWSFFRPCESLDPGIAGMGDCEGLFTYSKSKRMIARKYLVRYF